MTETREKEAAENVVEARDLYRAYRRTVALDGVSLVIPKGKVFGLVGENGAGKTTFIRHVMGLLRTERGNIRVFGMDPVKEPEKVLARIGFLSEDRDMPRWMKVRELMGYMRTFFPDWDDRYADELLQLFELDPRAKLGTLSRGQLAKAGLLAALAHKPDLLVLDEPSSGLDVMVRREILSAVIRTAADEGRTVLFSSHLLEEVERVADHVAMIASGKVVLDEPMEVMRDEFQRVLLAEAPPEDAAPLPGLLTASRKTGGWTAICRAPREEVEAAVNRNGSRILAIESPPLEDIFVASVQHQKQQKAEKALAS
jgi:ABC-2 type transport system ATP-binding protein